MIARPFSLRKLGALALGAAVALSAPALAAGHRASTVARVWASSSDASRKLAPQPALPLERAGTPAADELVIDPAHPQQAIVGYGAAMTDASAQLFLTVLRPAERGRLFADLFGRKGLALNFVRVPIGASDFSSVHYSLDDMPAGQTDPALAHFSMAGANAAQVPALKAARRANPGLVLMATPWSAPGWMKDSGSLIKGRLRPEFYGAYAAYFGRYLDAMGAAGLPVRYVSVQNEPRFEPENYPGMRFDAADRARFSGQFLGPLLAARRQPVGILDWDHNWDHPEEPLAVLADPVAARQIAGVAWHCYSGDPAAMRQVRAAYPEKELFFTECSGGEWAPDWGSTLGWMIDKLIIAPTRAGSRGSLLWNLALDENHGPHLGGCGTCRGVVTIDRRTRAVTRNVEYYVLGHVSRFVRPGAHALPVEGGPAGMTSAAFANPDGSLVLLVHNGANHAQALTVRAAGQALRAGVPAGEVLTLTWRQR